MIDLEYIGIDGLLYSDIQFDGANVYADLGKCAGSVEGEELTSPSRAINAASPRNSGSGLLSLN